jgi:hypothetical protein
MPSKYRGEAKGKLPDPAPCAVAPPTKGIYEARPVKNRQLFCYHVEEWIGG